MLIRRYFTLLLLISSMVPFSAHGAQVPHEFGGITLGADITEYPHLDYSNFLKEVVVTNWNGFAKGMISYGVCERPGKIVKIRFKYQDTSKRFYKSILKNYKAKFGKPDTWEGDAFGIQHIWKWSFVDGDNNRVSMVIQHNLKDPKLPLGTVVTLSYPDKIEREKTCFDKMRAMDNSNFDHSDCLPNCPMIKDRELNLFMIPK